MGNAGAGPPARSVPAPYSVGLRPVAQGMQRGRSTRRLSQQVMKLQQDMFMLLVSGKFREAVDRFEAFVNEGFKEGSEMNLPKGQVPLNRRPGEFQFLQYIHALHR